MQLVKFYLKQYTFLEVEFTFLSSKRRNTKSVSLPQILILTHELYYNPNKINKSVTKMSITGEEQTGAKIEVSTTGFNQKQM